MSASKSSRTHFRFSASRCAWAVAAAWGLMAGASPVAAQDAAAFVPGRVLLMPKAGLPDAALARILQDNGGGSARRIGKTELRIVELRPGQERHLLERLQGHPHIKFAELDMIVRPDFAPNDPYLGSEWHAQKIGAPAAWDSTLGAGVTIAILDTGVDGSHPDLAPSLVAGWNVYDNNANTADVYGHGTKVAGAAAAAANNGLGVAGVAGGARIMPIRISSPTGGASFSAMASGITWAADHGARVANISYVCAGSAAVISAAQYMKGKGGLVTSSAGNYGTDAGIAPTTAMIPVSATDPSDALPSWSSFGSFVAVAAPGEGIYTTTVGGGYGSVSGTSFSAPITAGVVALMMAAKPSLPGSTVESLLYATATDLGAAGRDAYFGHGRINATAAVQAALAAAAGVDGTAPVVSIAAPLGASTVSGLVSVDVSASDNVGVSKVELLAGGALVATDTAAPYGFSWDSTGLANGMQSLQARAYDAAGNVAGSTVVSVNVANTVVADVAPPVVAFSSPAAGAKVSGVVSVKVGASDNSGAAGIRQTLSINGKVVASASGASLSYNWNTRKESAASFTLTAVAKDAAGNASTATLTLNR